MRSSLLLKLREGFERTFFGENYITRFDPHNSERSTKALIIKSVFENIDDDIYKLETVNQLLLGQEEAIKRFLRGEQVTISSGICGRTTYGYGKPDDFGYWEFELPEWFVASAIFDKHRINV